MKIELTENCILVKSAFSKKEIPYTGITNAFMRVQEVTAKMCCGRANFDRNFLVLVCDGNEEVFELGNAKLIKDTLGKLKEKNPDIIIGKPAA